MATKCCVNRAGQETVPPLESLQRLDVSMKSQLSLSQTEKLPSKLVYQIVEVFRFV